MKAKWTVILLALKQGDGDEYIKAIVETYRRASYGIEFTAWVKCAR